MPKGKVHKASKDKRKNSGNLRTWAQKKADKKKKK
jgi:hypothetical protein|tara:strand:+ start:86 stop:190 length:105 start_codon:yes stop_codon:yes gene_type:complete